MKTKFVTALEGLLSMEPKKALALSAIEIEKRFDCAKTCANYARQALKYILSSKA
jgi:hypothetical protein